jgi:hypothetical protein
MIPKPTNGPRMINLSISYYACDEDRHESDTSTKHQRVNSRGDPMIHSLALRACM